MKLSEPPLVAVLPIVGTATAYLFEAGFAGFHGIPFSLLQLSVAQFVGTAVAGLLCFWVLHIYISLGLAFLGRRKHLIYKFLGLGMLYAFLPAILIVGIGTDTRLLVGFIIMFLLPLAMGLVETLRRKDRSEPFLQRWWKYSASVLLEPERPADQLHSVIDVPQMWFAGALLLIFLSFALGGRYAAIANPSQRLQSDPDKVLVVVYGERWFFRDAEVVSISRASAKDELLILSGDRADQIVLLPAKSASAPP